MLIKLHSLDDVQDCIEQFKADTRTSYNQNHHGKNYGKGKIFKLETFTAESWTVEVINLWPMKNAITLLGLCMNYFLNAPQINFQCSLNYFLLSPSRIFQLPPI